MEIRQTRTTWKPADKGKSHDCLWMQSGAIKKKYCSQFHACDSCRYDKAMQERVETGQQVSWQKVMREKGGINRVCRHTMTGRFDMKACPMNYNCSRCEFDQYLEDTLAPRIGPDKTAMKNIKGFELAGDRFFHKGHAWVSIESGGIVRIGLDDFSFKLLGEADAFELPLAGQELQQDKIGWGMKVGGNLADVRSPVNGVVTQTNISAGKQAASDPYDSGWLMTVHNNDIRAMTEDLFAEGESVLWLEDEIETLENMIESVAGPLSADGGFIQPNVYGAMPSLGWQNLTRRFLGT